jgi:alanyl-tRNA synthetase
MCRRKFGGKAMTKKLFWENQYQVEFDATITKIIGNSVVLDATGFCPQGGGQVGDTGYLNGIRVVDTQPGEETDIAHILETKPFFSVGASVHGKIDWERRYEIMRLHSAAHIVYFLMQEVFGEDCKPASSGLLDEEKERSDYLFEEKLDEEKLKLVEEIANQIIRKGYEIKTWSENGKKYWKMELFPAMKCGGTHVKDSSEIGEIKVKRGKKRGKGKERIEISLLP